MTVTVQPDSRPDLTRAGVGLVKRPPGTSAPPSGSGPPSRPSPRPGRAGTGPVPDCSRTASASARTEDAPPLLAVEDEDAYQEFLRAYRDDRNEEIDAAVPGIQRLGPRSYELYRSGGLGTDDRRIPGCVVIVDVEFDGPDAERQRAWVDGVFEALETEPHPAAGRDRRALPHQRRRDPGAQLRRVGERRGTPRGAGRARRRGRVEDPAVGEGAELPRRDRWRREPVHARAEPQRGRVADGTAVLEVLRYCGFRRYGERLRAEAQDLRVVVAVLVGELRVDVHAVVVEVADRRAGQDLVEDLVLPWKT